MELYSNLTQESIQVECLAYISLAAMAALPPSLPPPPALAPAASVGLQGGDDAANHEGEVETLGAEVEHVDGHVREQHAAQEFARLVRLVCGRARDLDEPKRTHLRSAMP